MPLYDFDVLESQENACGGILVVTLPGYGSDRTPEGKRSFFSDEAVDRGIVLRRLCDWFPLWGIPLARVRCSDSAFERSFLCAQWPQDQIENARGPQLVGHIAQQYAPLVELLERRRPRLIILLSCYLLQAMNTEPARSALKPILGEPSGTGRRITQERLAAYHQSWANAQILALPMPSKNTTEAYVKTLAAGVQRAFSMAGVLPQDHADPLLSVAASQLMLDRAASILSLRANLHVDEKRANALFDALRGKVWERDEAGRPKLTGRS